VAHPLAPLPIAGDTTPAQLIHKGTEIVEAVMADQPLGQDAEDTEPEAIERRASTRYPCNLATSCRLVASLPGECVPARVRNISVGGLSLVTTQAFDPGSLIGIELRSMTRNIAHTLQVRIIYSIEHPSGDWIAGARFVQPLKDEELKAFLS
jgi:hypothetical protein